MSTSQPSSTERTQVLARVEQALAQVLAQIQERERALAQPAVPPQVAPTLDFSRFEATLTALAACPARAAQRLQRLGSDLAEGETALRQWLQRAESTRRQLATGVGRAVG
jgi:hypothetical protein